MKLLNRTTVYYLLFALPVFIICSIFIYYFISNEIKDELDENLLKEKIEVEHKLEKGISPEMIIDSGIIIRNYPSGEIPKYYFTDTNLYNTIDQEILPYRILNAYTNLKGQNYALTIRQSYVESDDLISSILIPIISMFVALLIGFLFINYWIAKKVWSPFYETIEKLKKFDLNIDQSLQFSKANIKEFNELNQSLNIMTQKVYTDYLKQKEFTENASHEIQTPLAIIQNKVELLIQSNRLGNEEMEIISGIYDSATRLSHLNKTLLLLTKIENNQFTDNRTIEIKTEVEKSIELFLEQAEHKNISIKSDLENNVTINMNPALCDILLNNLLLNAIRHNNQNGCIEIELKKGQLTISNTGRPTTISSNHLFERFKKDTSSSESIGLGLSIVKSICKTYSISINHSYKNEKHIFTLNF